MSRRQELLEEIRLLHKEAERIMKLAYGLPWAEYFDKHGNAPAFGEGPPGRKVLGTPLDIAVTQIETAISILEDEAYPHPNGRSGAV